MLERLARTQPMEDVRREALSEMKSAEALTIIIDIAREYPDREVRKRAIELLGESKDPRAQSMLERILQRP